MAASVGAICAVNEGMKASIVVPVWNGRDYLADCLNAVLEQSDGDIEVLVVDNGSVDGSADLVARKYPQVRLIRSLSNLGFAGGCNVGLRAAAGDALVLLNQDTQVQPGWLRSLIARLESPNVGIVGCKILYPDGMTVQHAGGWIEWPLGIAHHYGQGERDVGQWDAPREVEYVTGAAMAIRRDVLERIGSFDEGFWPGYFEDSDLCFRAREKGFAVWYEPEALVLHVETASTNDPAKASYRYQRGRLRFVLKHLSPQRFLKEFVPAERAYQPSAVRGWEGGPLQAAYLNAMAVAATLLSQRWQASRDITMRVLLALQELYERSWEEDRIGVAEAIVGSGETLGVGETLTLEVPSLKEFEFQSNVPVFGRFITRLRTLWYSVAARWAVRDLIRQQEMINRRQVTYVRYLERTLISLAEANAVLAREISAINLRDADEG